MDPEVHFREAQFGSFVFYKSYHQLHFLKNATGATEILVLYRKRDLLTVSLASDGLWF